MSHDRCEYPGGVYWFDPPLCDALEEAWRLLAVEFSAPEEGVAPLSVVQSAISLNLPALLVFDGVRSPATIAQVRSALASTGACVLYTCEYDPPANDSSMVRMAPVTLEAAVDLFERGSTAAPDPVACGRIARLLGRNALAMRVAACMASGPGGVARLADELARAVFAGSSTAAAVLYSLFEYRWPRLPEPVRHAWLLAASCAPDAQVPWPWIAAALGHLGANDALADAAGPALARESGAMVGSGGQTLRLHPIAHAFARGRYSTLDEPLQDRLDRALAAGVCEVLESALAAQDTPACVRALAHIEPVLALRARASADVAMRLGAAIALAVVRAGDVGHVERVREVLDTALSADALANPAWCDQAIELLNAFVEVDAVRDPGAGRGSHVAVLGEREAQLAILLRAQGRRDALDRARQLLEQSVARASDSAGDELVAASRRVELARTLLDVGSVDALHTAREQIDIAQAVADRAGVRGAGIALRAGALATDIASALRSAQAAGLRR
jgi:hypothetical protein